MSVPLAVEKVFADVLSAELANVFRGGAYDDIGNALERGDFPVVCECEVAEAHTLPDRRCWQVSINIESCTTRDVPIDRADAAADFVFNTLGNLETELVSAAADVGLQFADIEPTAQGVRTEESVRTIYTTYTLKVAGLPTV